MLKSYKSGQTLLQLTPLFYYITIRNYVYWLGDEFYNADIESGIKCNVNILQ